MPRRFNNLQAKLPFSYPMPACVFRAKLFFMERYAWRSCRTLPRYFFDAALWHSLQYRWPALRTGRILHDEQASARFIGLASSLRSSDMPKKVRRRILAPKCAP
jgi:hypothetical protein